MDVLKFRVNSDRLFLLLLNYKVGGGATLRRFFILFVVMQILLLSAFAFFLVKQPLRVVTTPLVATSTEDDLWASSPDISFFSDPEPLPSIPTNDNDLFASSAGETDFSTLHSDTSDFDAFCSMDVGIGDDQGGSDELSDSIALDARDLEDENLDLFTDSSGPQCASRSTPKKPKKDKDVTVPQLPSLRPFIYPEAPSERCPSLLRPVSACCAARVGMNPYDCWPCNVQGFPSYTDADADQPLVSLLLAWCLVWISVLL